MPHGRDPRGYRRLTALPCVCKKNPRPSDGRGFFCILLGCFVTAYRRVASIRVFTGCRAIEKSLHRFLTSAVKPIVHASARGSGAPDRYQALREGASILIQHRFLAELYKKHRREAFRVRRLCWRCVSFRNARSEACGFVQPLPYRFFIPREPPKALERLQIDEFCTLSRQSGAQAQRPCRSRSQPVQKAVIPRCASVCPDAIDPIALQSTKLFSHGNKAVNFLACAP